MDCPIEASGAFACVQGASAMRTRETAPATPPPPLRRSDYAELLRLVKQAGLLGRRRRSYIWRITATVTLLAAGWAVFVLVGDSWWQLAVAAFLAVMFTQIAFLGHDAGHRQISGSRRVSYVLGILLGNLGIGLSYGWWVGKHNRHHAPPNTQGADPDISMRVLAFTPAQAGAGRGLYRMVFRYQAYLFFPLLLGEAFSVHVASISALAGRDARARPAEAALLAINLAGYLAAVFLVLPPVKAVVFILVQQGLFGVYLAPPSPPTTRACPSWMRPTGLTFCAAIRGHDDGGAVVSRMISWGAVEVSTERLRPSMRSQRSRAAVAPRSWAAWSTLVKLIGALAARVVLS